MQNEAGTWSLYKMVGGRRRKVTRRTKTAARAAMADIEAAVARGDDELVRQRQRRERQRGATVAEVLSQFLELDLASRDRAPSTVERHRWAADRVVAAIGKREVRALKVTDVEQMLAAAALEGLARSSLEKLRSTLSQALRAGVRREIVDRDVARDAVLPPKAPRRQARNALQPEEARTLLAALRNERNGLAFALGLRLGLRPGEAFGLFWDDITDEHVNVARGLRRTGGKVEVVDEVKTAGSRRTLAMPNDLRPWVDEHRRQQTAMRLAAASWADDRLVFATADGRPVQPDVSRKQLADICERSGLPRTRPNELRHSCASLLSDEGVPNELIADLLGHTTTRMVDQTYRHRLRPVVDVAATAAWATDER